jgi:hypothetical protein
VSGPLTAAATALALALSNAPAKSHREHDARRIALAAALACASDADPLGCVVDAVTWSYGESGLREAPTPYSWDAKLGLSVGAFQIRRVAGYDDVFNQARRWVWLRRASLAACGDLTAVASGSCGRARGLTTARARAAAAYAWALSYGILSPHR